MRVLAWFSCGAASAVAAKLSIEKYGDACEVVYCDTMASENRDNVRFMKDAEAWFGRKVTFIKSTKYHDIDQVFWETKYMAGPAGARCTVEMKKVPRFKFQLPDDIHVFGYTSEEARRITNFEANNPELTLEWPLRDRGLSKDDCFAILKYVGIELPLMYRQGYRNNNCVGCVKASSSKYWNSIRRDYPEVFGKRAIQSRVLGARLAWYKGKRIFLDELPEDVFTGKDENISCGPECGTSEVVTP
jgi:3'-phosphoadenosine 5'-phosphosulfate sulfotransferase (PAPS reductase)/FAD synthetase